VAELLTLLHALAAGVALVVELLRRSDGST
jgi:hypothetical protein